MATSAPPKQIIPIQTRRNQSLLHKIHRIMEIDKPKLNNKIESVIINGACTCEDETVTAKKVMAEIEPLFRLINYLKSQLPTNITPQPFPPPLYQEKQ